MVNYLTKVVNSLLDFNMVSHYDKEIVLVIRLQFKPKVELTIAVE